MTASSRCAGGPTHSSCSVALMFSNPEQKNTHGAKKQRAKMELPKELPPSGDALNRLPKEVWMPHPCRHSSQAGCGSGQPGLLVGDPAHSRGLELDEHCGPFQPRPSYGSMILSPVAH